MKVKHAFKTVLFLSLSVVVFVISSCGQQTQPTKETQATEIDKDQVKESVSVIMKNIPSPYEMTSKLEQIGASYIENTVNPIDKLDKYFTEKNKALNLGVYGADLAYVSTYEKKQETSIYASTVKELVDQLKINVDINDLSSDETKEKIQNKDSLADILTNTFYEVYDFLNENSDPSLAALVATGLWVEGLYIAMQISDETFQNNDFVSIIFNQQKSLAKLIELLDLFKDDQIIVAHKNALIKLNSQFESTNGSLTMDQLKSIDQTITAIRSSIVE